MVNSQSGLAAAYTDAKKNDFWFKRRIISGSHKKSCEMVANGKADIACIDSITWRFIEKYTSLKNQIRIISKTDPTPGLPYISSIEANQSVIFNSIKIAIEKLNKNEKNILGIERIVWIAKSEYLKYENPPEDATRGDLSITPGSY
jgi:ABC-type phosphate/phosphonate transport system substrate-binding protein